MASKLSLLYHTSTEIINTYGWSYFLRIASYELRKQGFDLFRNPTLDYYSELESKIETQEDLYNRYMENFDLEVSKRNISPLRKDLQDIISKTRKVITFKDKLLE